MQVNAVSSQVTKTSVCVCVYRGQSVLGLEVEVISLIGTLSSSLPTSLSPSPPALLMKLFSVISSLPYYLSQSFSFSLLLSSTPSLSCYLSLFISHLFSAAGCLWSLQSTRGIETSIARRDRERSDKIREREKRDEEKKRCTDSESHWSQALDNTHTHAHAHSLMPDRANSIYTYRAITWQPNHCYWLKCQTQ